MKRFDKVGSLMRLLPLCEKGDATLLVQKTLADELIRGMANIDSKILKSPTVSFRDSTSTMTLSFFLNSANGWDEEIAFFTYNKNDDTLKLFLEMPRSRLIWVREMINTIMDEEV